MKIKKIAKFDYHSLSSNNVGFFLFFVRLLQGNLLRGIGNKTVIEKITLNLIMKKARSIHLQWIDFHTFLIIEGDAQNVRLGLNIIIYTSDQTVVLPK